ncbi:MAG: hypothetical protein IH991_11540 [Planctomycetes bacterium]|nr:hypothetical protein [Planctomycetota bacterium]
MKITDVEALHLRIPDVAEIADGTQDVLVVRVHADNGLIGIGEVTSQSYVCKAIVDAPRSAERRHGLRHILVGQEFDPEVAGEIERLWLHLYYHTNRYGRRGAAIHAISGIDIALWDLCGKALEKPVYELLGGKQLDTIRAYASYLFGETPEETAELAREAGALGLTAAKFGWGGFGRDAEVDHRLDAGGGIGQKRDAVAEHCQHQRAEYPGESDPQCSVRGVAQGLFFLVPSQSVNGEVHSEGDHRYRHDELNNQASLYADQVGDALQPYHKDAQTRAGQGHGPV